MAIKLMQFGLPNRIDVVESNLKSEYNRQIIVDSDFNDLIESTMSIIDYIRSKIDLFSIKSIVFDIKSIVFDIKSIKRLIKIDLLSINQSKMVEFYRKLVVFDRKRQYISKKTLKIDIVDSIKSLKSESTIIWRSNSDFRLDSTTSIRFGSPNRISLLNTSHVLCSGHNYHLIYAQPSM